MSRVSHDQTVLSVITQLRAEHPKVTGRLVRDRLRELTGRPGGVGRVYRLLKISQVPAPLPESKLAARVERLKTRLVKALARARRAEHREQSHQETWARQIDALQQRLEKYTVRELRPEQRAERELKTHRELHIARYRIQELEQEVARLRAEQDRAP